MSDVVNEFSISIDQVQDYEFRVRFDKEQYPNLLTDEPAPLGHDTAPNPSRILAAAIGNCLSASLLFCARKNRVRIDRMHTDVKVQIIRNQNKRLRVGRVEVVLDPRLEEAERQKATVCLPLFEDFCTVTQSLRAGMDVRVTVAGLTPE